MWLFPAALACFSNAFADQEVLCKEALDDSATWVSKPRPDERHGLCRFFLKEGDSPFGEQAYVRGKKHGPGKQLFHGGDRIEANYIEGKLDGEVRHLTSSGKVTEVQKFARGKLLSEKTDYSSKQFPQIEDFQSPKDAIQLSPSLGSLECGKVKYLAEAGDVIGDHARLEIREGTIKIDHTVGEGEAREWIFTGRMDPNAAMQVLAFDLKDSANPKYREGEMRFSLSKAKGGRYELQGRSYVQYSFEPEGVDPIDIRKDLPLFREIRLNCRPAKKPKAKA